LNADEQRAWRAFLKGANRLMEHLDDSLQEHHELALTDFEILVVLSEAPSRRLRMSEIADRVLVSRSRLTYRVDHLVKRGLVVRSGVAGDGRGTNAELTDVGLEVLQSAARTHVDDVRINLVDHIPAGELGMFTRIWTSVSDRCSDTAAE
jgi:DNA-binding MarR family transcriptional regulator